MKRLAAGALALLIAFAAPSPGEAQRPPDGVRLTWLSVTNWLLEAGDTRILLDAGFSRVPESAIVDWSRSTGAVTADTALALRIVEAVAPGRRLDWILVGHGHFDNSLDASALARATGARIAGARTICHQAVALGVEAERCLAVEGGEVIEIGPFVRMRVVRWHHSGASSSEVGRLLRAPLELRAPPTPDPATGGLRPGIHEDYPNGGGSRGYLITVQTSWGPVTLLWTNTGNAEAWDVVLDADSTLLGERGVDMSNLEWAMADGRRAQRWPTRCARKRSAASTCGSARGRSSTCDRSPSCCCRARSSHTTGTTSGRRCSTACARRTRIRRSSRRSMRSASDRSCRRTTSIGSG
jgi:hypothetical protein